MSNSELLFMSAALRQAEAAAAIDEVPIGAVIVENGQIIAKGHNRRIIDNDPTAHAEIVALREAAKCRKNWNLSGCDIYVTLEPCVMCSGALVLARINQLIFAANDLKGGAISLDISILENEKLNHRLEIKQGPLQKESSDLLSSFFRKKRAEQKNL